MRFQTLLQTVLALPQGPTQAAMARTLGVDRHRLGHLLRGRREVSLAKLVPYCQALGLDTETLLQVLKSELNALLSQVGVPVRVTGLEWKGLRAESR